MIYDPFPRGPATVGVRTITVRDETRDGRTLEVELWHPAADSHRGQDLLPETQDRFEFVPGAPTSVQRAVRDVEPAPGLFPLLVFMHGAYAHRRQSTGLCTHLASHGYLVAAPDFTGNTAADQMRAMRPQAGATPRLATMVQSAMDRPLDARFVIDRVLGGAAPGVSELVDGERIGALGQSFGGWTCLALNAADTRPKACFPIVPPWGGGVDGTGLFSDLAGLDDWGRDVPTFILAAERDAMVRLDDARELYRGLKAPKRLAVLREAGHVHFADDPEATHEALRASFASNDYPVGDGPRFDFPAMAAAMRPFAELCPASHGEAVANGLCLAHMDAHLKKRPEASALLNGNLIGVFAALGIDLDVR